MKRVELYGRVRHAVMIEGLSQREAARCFGIDPRTVRKMLSYSVPPGYVRTRPSVRPKLDPFIGIIDRILEEDKDRPKTHRSIFERLRDQTPFPIYKLLFLVLLFFLSRYILIIFFVGFHRWSFVMRGIAESCVRHWKEGGVSW